ncbi:RNA polymerase sigma-70 factor [uncultured Parabacteroides sp.]|uniref:RNA polymerase sigma-70 factor n=1 Tax=uncultured Parabacteroides sp. TaxID=512312 RepID=UPI0025F99079|nr:RNA polymerase sigma-70 factor [uncultured Parabacteroides sp.]
MMRVEIDIDRIREGDHTAFKNFFEYFYPKLMALACRFVDNQVAKDLVQEVFTAYWEQKQMIRVENIKSFLYKWVQNSCLNYIKHQMVVDEYESRVRIAEARIAFLEESSDSNEVLKQVINQDLREIIEVSVNKLPPKCAQAFRLCYFHDVSRKEAAEIMDISPRTVEGHIRQALAFLREDLKGLFMLILMLCDIN